MFSNVKNLMWKSTIFGVKKATIWVYKVDVKMQKKSW